MGLETATYIDDLVVTNPVGSTDPKAQGDNHLRLLKSTIKATFPGMAGRAWRFQSKSDTYNVVVTDNMSVIKQTGASKTINLPAAATVGNGFLLNVTVTNATGVTIDANSTELINGAETQLLAQNWFATLFCDGSAWTMVALPLDMGGLIGQQWLLFKQPNEGVEFGTGVLSTIAAWPQDATILDVIGALVTPSSSGTVILDMHVDGATVMATDKLDIEANEASTLSAATQPAITQPDIEQGDQVTFECDDPGTGAAGWEFYVLVEWQ